MDVSEKRSSCSGQEEQHPQFSGYLQSVWYVFFFLSSLFKETIPPQSWWTFFFFPNFGKFIYLRFKSTDKLSIIYLFIYSFLKCLAFIEHMPGTILNILHISSYLILTSPPRKMLFSIPSYRWVDWGLERLSSLPKVTQKVCGRARVQTQVSLTPEYRVVFTLVLILSP